MICFDIKSLFTKLPASDCLDHLKLKLPNISQLKCPVSVDILIRLIESCTNDCFFNFNDNFHQQISG